MDLQLPRESREIDTKKVIQRMSAEPNTDEIKDWLSFWNVRFWCLKIACASNIVAIDAIAIAVILQKSKSWILAVS